MNTESQTRWAFRINAVVNWVLSVRGIVDPNGAAELFGGPPPTYPFVIQLWSAFVFMFGCMFFEVSRDVRGKVHLVKYNWIEKTLTAVAVTSGFIAGTAPLRLMLLITLTNWLWIPYLLHLDIALRRRTGESRTPVADAPRDPRRVAQHADAGDPAAARFEVNTGEHSSAQRQHQS
ncbi:MAG: hypothetical protein IT377_29665 [Polyangiaceae bacterium]|nr:hypothetical protein [Polyangiaceae bacterium]